VHTHIAFDIFKIDFIFGQQQQEIKNGINHDKRHQQLAACAKST
jgi:hypothetical protein